MANPPRIEGKFENIRQFFELHFEIAGIMPRIDRELQAQNPWWLDRGAIGRDPHIRQYRDGGLSWTPPALESASLRPGDTDTLRGPRQVGKTTTAKRIVERLLTRGEARVLYFSLDVVRDFRDLPDLIVRAKRLHPEPEGPWYIFLDEVTSVPDWQLGIKSAWDRGATRDDYLLLTGSSAHDLRRGAERLPGRRGNGTDCLQLPMSFRDFARAAAGVELPEETLGVEDCLTPAGRSTLAALNLRAEQLSAAWSAYRRVGGYPAAVRDFVATRQARVSDATYRALWDAVAGDIARSGRDAVAALKLLEEVGVSLGNPLKWTAAGKAMGVSDVTARQYVEYLAESFALVTMYFWDLAGRTLQPGKQRKVYFVDPLLGFVPAHLIPGARIPPEHGVVENLVAMGLFRAAAYTMIQAGAVPGSIAYWRSSDKREIDFVVPAEREGVRIPVEVKGDAGTGIGHARAAIRRVFRRGVVVSRSAFDWAEDVPVIPAPVFLAALSERPRRLLSVA
jgi:hypothetical protein